MTDKLPTIIKWKPQKDELGFPQPDIPIKYVECSAIAERLKCFLLDIQTRDKKILIELEREIKNLIHELEGEK